MYASQSAQFQALSTPEILELILLQLDMRTLLTSAQRVCRLWADLTKKSPYIQEALFLTPVRDNNTNTVAVNKVRNPLLAEAFPSIFQNTNTISAYEEEEHDVFTLTSFDLILNPEKKEAYLRPGASWRRMLVQQPPIPKIAIFQVFYGMSIGYRYYEIPRDPRDMKDGIRMDMLFEVLLFNEHLDIDVNRIVWQGHVPPSLRHSWSELERHGKIKMDTDIVICTKKWNRCYDSDSDSDSDSQTADERARNQIRASYRNLGLRPKWQGHEKRSEMLEWSILWD